MRKNNKSGQIVSAGAKIARWTFSAILFFYTSITIAILISTLLNAFKTKSDLISNMVGWPKAFTLDSFINVIFKDDFMLYFKNSVLATGLGTFFCILLASMVAYGIARYEFKGKGVLSTYFLLGMMFPIQISVLPLFLILKNLGMLNKLSGLILVYAAGMSLPVLVFRNFFKTVPKSLEESARLDGASELTIFFRIVLPLCKPVISTIALINAVGYWNDFYMPMVFLGRKSCRTLTLAIYTYTYDFLKNMNVSFAAVIITLIPIIVLYCLFSRQIVEGLSSGAVKG